MKNTLLLLLALITGIAAPAQQIYYTTKGSVQVFAQTKLENIDGKNDKVSAYLNRQTGKVVISVPMQSFRFKIKLMQEQFHEKHLKTKTYPEAKFVGFITNLEAVNFSRNGQYPVQVEGELTMHGITQKQILSATITIEDQKLLAESQFRIIIAEYNIEPPQVFGSNVGREIQVTSKFSMVPFEE